MKKKPKVVRKPVRIKPEPEGELSEAWAKPEPKTIETRGRPAVYWVCEQSQGGCGAQGAIPGRDVLHHWQRGGRGSIQCRCGATIVIGESEKPRIVTLEQHARETKLMGAR